MANRYRKIGKIKPCLVCKADVYIEPNQEGRKKFCSKKCFYLGRELKMTFQKEHPDLVPANKRGHTEETKMKISLGGIGKHSGSLACNWKGDNVGYFALHHWINRILGKPDICVDCGMSGLKGHKIHWANISGKYKRINSDWRRLCVKCHKAFDMSRALVS